MLGQISTTAHISASLFPMDCYAAKFSSALVSWGEKHLEYSFALLV